MAMAELDQPDTYGISGTSIYNLGPDDFSVMYGFAPLSHLFSNLAIFPTTQDTTISLTAPLHLPAGAQIVSVTFFYYDSWSTDPAGYIAGAGSTGGPAYSYLQPIAFPAFSGGNNAVTAVLPTPLTIDNLNTHYSIFAELTAQQKLYRVRVTYKLQVSPAPATATFNDVPVGNPYHRFVEALVASGITGGCGGGNYCPDAPVTRAQMAVFIAAALGLHWPN
jgi:hypothetical protein